MKKIVFILLLMLPLATFGQGFFKPVPGDMFSGNDRAIKGTWLVRPHVGLTAMQINLSDKTVTPFSSVGMGVSYAHFIEQAGEPYQILSANLVLLFGQQLEDTEPINLSIAGSVTFWQYLSLGVGYTFDNKNVFFLTGISYSFNK